MKKRSIVSIISVLLLLAVVFTNAAPAGAYPSNHFLNVPVIMQPYSNWCWAACGACVVQYLHGTSTTTPSHFSYATQHNYSNTPKTLEEVQHGLEFYYIENSVVSYNTVVVSGGTVSVTAISYSTVANSIWGSKPIIAARFPYTLTNGVLTIDVGHDYVIEGYFTENNVNRLSLMNPASSTMQTMAYSTFKKTSSFLWGAQITNIYISGNQS